MLKMTPTPSGDYRRAYLCEWAAGVVQEFPDLFVNCEDQPTDEQKATIAKGFRMLGREFADGRL